MFLLKLGNRHTYQSSQSTYTHHELFPVSRQVARIVSTIKIKIHMHEL